jgi:hypothetical protein
VQWSVALECYEQQSSSRLRRIYPILIGERDGAGGFHKLFDSPNYRNLPPWVPSPSLDKAAELLRDLGVTPGPNFTKMTLQQIVDKLAKETLSQYANASIDQEISKCVNEVLKMLRETRNKPGDSGAVLPAIKSDHSAPTASTDQLSAVIAPIVSADSDTKSVAATCSEGASIYGIECKTVIGVASPAPLQQNAKMTLREMTNEIKRQCELGDEYNTVTRIMEGALTYLGDDSIRQHFSTIDNKTCQAEYLLKQIVG